MSERSVASATRTGVEEIHFRSELVYVCLVVNRRQKSARVVDFLAGNFPQKQAALQQLATKEGIQRLFTLVEREESTGWSRVGYAREGSIPGYYKRSDAYVMGHLIHDPPAVNADGTLVPPIADQNRAERSINAAKKLKDVVAPKSARMQVMSDADVAGLKPLVKGKKSLPTFEERFGRTGARLHLGARDPRNAKAHDQIVTAEVQECFGNAYLQVTTTPSTEIEARNLVAALNGMVETLRGREVASTFAFAPVDDLLIGAAMLAAGFRKTGLLAKHLIVGDQRVDAIMWTRKTGLATDAADAA